ncbi:CAP domain-containing protein [Methanocaldococcus sp.]|uniref:CAP domain-containing protein n=1 Tax=Methanocaldococcus sp. TaxID=2152917 RepID=UPI00262659EE|nr:CAP domain-containing protein [Methanocaldococcus sp.]MCQ6254739.1 CAP domain-containing protein [Methanocaldococcus sp.]
MNPRKLRKRIYDEINKERRKLRLKPLKLSKSLSKMAIRDALNRKNCSVHYAVKGEKHITVAKRIVKEWIRNPAHRKYILNPKYNSIGLGVHILWNKNTKEYEIYVCKKFRPSQNVVKNSKNKKHNNLNTKKLKKLIFKNKRIIEYFLLAVMFYILLYIAFKW